MISMLATGCGASDTAPGTAPLSPRPPNTSSASTPTSAHDRGSIVLGDHSIGYAADTSRYAVNDTEGRLQFVPTGPKDTAAWADWFLMAPTSAYDPATQERGPLPEDPVSWLRDNPMAEVLGVGSLEVMGAKATAVDLRTRSDTEYFGDVRGGVEAAGPGAVERFILWEVEGDWLLVRASTFLTPEKVSRVSADDDLRRFLTSLRPA